MACHQLIDGYVETLSRRLPRDAVDELADGLTEAWHARLRQGQDQAAAARAAIAEFGSPAEVVAAFVAQSPGRRTARLLVATGPLVGLCWAAGLLAERAWTWGVPAGAVTTFAIALPLVVGCLVVAATSRYDYRRTRLGVAGGLGLVALDLAALAAVLLAAPALAGPMALAIPASLARVGVAVHGVALALR